MNTIKFLPNNNILLKINFRNSTCEKLLTKIKYTKEYEEYVEYNKLNTNGI